jgi:hypothetical protein
MGRGLQRGGSRGGFFIDRRRDLKPDEKSDAKGIFTAYAERSAHGSIENFIDAIKSSHDVIQSKRTKEETKLSNEVTIYGNQDMAEKFLSVVTEFNIWKEHDTSVVISSENHMSINLKPD